MLRNKKVFMAVSLALSLIILPLSGCGKKTNDKTQAKDNKVSEISIAVRAGAMADAVEVVAKEYESKKGVKVKVNSMPYSSLKEKVVLDVRNKSGAFDLVMIDDPWMPEFAEGKLLAPLDSYFKEGVDKDFVQKCADLCRHPYKTGNLYALPLIGNVQMFFYRDDLLKKHNLKAPKTWDEVVNIAETILKNEKDISGYVLRGQRGNPIVTNYIPMFWAYGGKVLDENNKPHVNSEAGIKAMETYIKLKNLGPKGVETFDSDQIATTLTQGKVAMTIAWPSWVATVDNPKSSKVVNKVGFSAVPGKVSFDTAVIGNWLLGIPNSSLNKDAAVDFLKYITSKESQKTMALQGGGVPTRTSVYKDEELQGKYRHYEAQLDALTHSAARPRTPYWSQIEDVWGLYLSEILSGKMDIKEGLDKANEAIEKILQ
ncbi:ABC transporter substrate-binding protein [Clostridium sp. ZS2-4]|uniref:ABC transporter substrate-binding protein n=1 Tax=Clostridium sp. ZS2-4 TaxID=2987703 RepID=UPI00227C8335|nr:ABC transporter substrate-binding protein [Clostridium sp. ZS2-4]MCY6355909.1 ABC transporter substrate-binding protein [Clostridium sp. ZS2-4]